MGTLARVEDLQLRNSLLRTPLPSIRSQKSVLQRLDLRMGHTVQTVVVRVPH